MTKIRVHKRSGRRARRWRALISITILAVVCLAYTQVIMQAADGDLDPRFGTGGKVTTAFGTGGTSATAIAIQADGKIVVTGSAVDLPGGLADIALARYLRDGSLDPAFGTGGKVRTDVDGSNNVGTAVAIQSDGRIVVAGSAFLGVEQSAFTLARYNTDGSLDVSFDGDGTLTTDFTPSNDDRATGVAVQADGRIVVVGVSIVGGISEFALARYNADGSLDASFDDDGKVTTDLGNSNDQAFAVVVQDDGGIVAVGTGVVSGNDQDFALVRYNPDGSLDPSFDGDGIVNTDFGTADLASAVALANDGKIVAAGATFNGPFGGPNVALARYTADGSLDPNFGSNGTVITDVPDGFTTGRAVAVQSDGSIVVAGFHSFNVNPQGSTDFALIRYTVDGSLDLTFGADGIVTTDFAESHDDPAAIAIQDDGSIVVAGTTFIPPAGETRQFAIARYQGQPPHTLTFFLHGQDIPGTAGGFTMNQTAPAPQVLLQVGQAPSWFSEPTVTGTFVAGSTVEVVLPCTLGLSLPKTIRLAATDADGGNAQLLGQVADGLRFCQVQTFTIPVATPTTLANQRLKLTIGSTLPVPLQPLRLGNQTFLRATNFVGTP